MASCPSCHTRTSPGIRLCSHCGFHFPSNVLCSSARITHAVGSSRQDSFPDDKKRKKLVKVQVKNKLSSGGVGSASSISHVHDDKCPFQVRSR
ncbi:unnamed protein product [Peronospora destructor]|uniref:Uncharacterized protein n=1 Tax=Peronospora destructor TaxID=86335 RepID=A0AAV0VAM3_9STRA|nr:unnamed protein product [Peronospora destructor]